MNNSSPNVDRLKNMTVSEFLYHFVVLGIGQSDAEWAKQRDQLVDQFRKTMDDSRSQIRAEALSSMFRNDEEEN